MDKDDLIKNLLGGVERNKENRLAQYQELAQGFYVMVNEFEKSGMDKQMSVAVALDIIKPLGGKK